MGRGFSLCISGRSEIKTVIPVAQKQRRGFRDTLREWWLRTRCPTEFLCDHCLYDHPSACTRPERPNAVKCPDYKPRSSR